MRACFHMSRATPQMRKFAKRLIVCETGGNKSSATKGAAAFPIPAKLRPQLTTLMGNGGFRALLSRALVLAQADVPWLCAVTVKTDGTLGGLEKIHAQPEPYELLEGRIVLLAELLGLMIAFIGESLTLRLVREVWPKVPLHDLDLSAGGTK